MLPMQSLVFSVPPAAGDRNSVAAEEEIPRKCVHKYHVPRVRVVLQAKGPRVYRESALRRIARRVSSRAGHRSGPRRQHRSRRRTAHYRWSRCVVVGRRRRREAHRRALAPFTGLPAQL